MGHCLYILLLAADNVSKTFLELTGFGFFKFVSYA